MSSEFCAWVGRSITNTDIVEPARSAAFGAAFGGVGDQADGQVLPLLHHWLYFWDVKPPEALGEDGHPKKGGFLPPIALPRRMWAGGRLTFLQPLHLGERITKVSTILNISEKSGKSGALSFVTVEHRISGETGDAIVEEQDLVYKLASASGPELPDHSALPPPALWQDHADLSAVDLFRYSALTMNGHRIHYDLPYAKQVEAYPALVVHGPLQATLLARFAETKLGRPLSRFEFRGAAPAFGDMPLHLGGDPIEGGAAVWTAQGGGFCMTAKAYTQTDTDSI